MCKGTVKIMKRKNKKSIFVKTMAGFLSVILMLTAVPFPEVNVSAETVTDATDSSKPVYVEFALDAGNSTMDYNQYSASVYNNSGQTICDWEVTVQFSVDPGFNAGWNGVSYDEATKTIRIQTYGESTWDNATILNGQAGSGAGFQIDAGMLDSATVELTYSVGESSGGTATTDTTTNPDLDVEFNYAKLLQQSLYFYDANMCGNLEDKCGVSWRGNCHTYDSNVTYTSGNVTYSVDASGGFHDAGDHVKFGLPQGYAASVLGMSYYQFKDAFTELKQDAHMKTIMDYFCDYFRRCTVYKQGSDDEVIAFCYQVGNGDTDHAIWTAPEDQTLERPAYFADASNPATDQVSLAIAALALNYINFGNEKDLKAAKDLFAFVQKNSLACATDGCQTYYNSTSYGDDYATAAAALYVATGKTDNTYLNVYNTYKDANSNGINQYWVMDWANSGALAAMLMGDTAKLSNITKAGQSGTKLDNVFWCLSDWGSCRYNSATQFVGLAHDKLASANSYTDWATSQMNYMIGDNPSKRCYAVGYNENSSKYPHHRAASRSTDDGLIVDNHYTLLGALVGGPGSDGTYKDAQDDYHCNEVALDYNAGYVGALAGLYLAHKGDTSVYLSYAGETTDNYGVDLSTREELSAVGVVTYYGQDSADNPPGTEDPEEPVNPEEPEAAVLTSSAESLVCSDLVYGYTEAASAKITITNTGEVQTTTSSIALEAGGDFELVSPSAEVTILPSETCVLEVKPKNGLAVGTYTDNVVITYDEKTLSIPVSVIVGKAAQTLVAETPTLISRSRDTISVIGAQEAEYSLDGVDWQSESTFGNLTEFTEYQIFARYKETATHKAGAVCAQPLVVYTLVAAPYTIDVSKIAGDNCEAYVNALRTAHDSEPTVTYADGVLTLTGENVTYTLTGTNEELKVKVVSGTTTLVLADGTTVGNIETPGTEAPGGGTEAPGGGTEAPESAVGETKIIIRGITHKVAPGKKIKLKATLYPENAAPQKILWKVSNKKYATVSASGVVKAKKAGKGKTVTVTAYSAENQSVCAIYKVFIMKKAVKKIKLSAKKTLLNVGKTITVKAKFTPSKGISKEVLWISSNPKVAIVDEKGKVTAIKKGTVKITAKAKDGSGKKAVIKIRVK